MHKGVVLVVDDDFDTCEVLQVALQSEGYVAITASDREQAKQLFESHKPFVMLVDFFMGASALSTFLDSFPATFPIVLMTGAIDCQKKARDLGLRFWIAKPFSIDGLVKLLRRAAREQPLPKNGHGGRSRSTNLASQI